MKKHCVLLLNVNVIIGFTLFCLFVIQSVFIGYGSLLIKKANITCWFNSKTFEHTTTPL